MAILNQLKTRFRHIVKNQPRASTTSAEDWNSKLQDQANSPLFGSSGEGCRLIQSDHSDRKVAEEPVEASLPVQQPVEEKEEVFNEDLYSHGMEEIYAIETVDLKSVRKLSDEKSESQPFKKKKLYQPPPKRELPSEQQLYLDLGPQHRQSMSSIAALLRVEKPTVEELNSETIDFCSWLHLLVKGIDPLKVSLFLGHYALDEIVQLSSSEKKEVEKIDKQQKGVWIEKVKEELISDENRSLFSSVAKEVFDVYISPWMRRREGIATKLEVEERLFRLCENSTLFHQILTLFQDVYGGDRWWGSEYLWEVSSNLFSESEESQKQAFTVIELTMSYLQDVNSSYRLDTLVNLLKAELASKWEVVSDSYLHRLLRRIEEIEISVRGGALILKLKNDLRF